MVIAEAKKLFIVIIGALLNAIGLNLFLIPADVYASGFTGVAQLLSSALDQYSPVYFSTGTLLFILNIPVGILGWLKVGRSFTVYSVLSVALTTVFLGMLPETSLSNDILLNAVFGGVISAVGIGLTLKYGASTGGLDIIAMILAKWKDKPVGTYFFILNGAIILTAGLLNGWEKALYTLVTLYVTTRVIDAIHTRHAKLTVMIVTKKAEEIKEAIYGKMVRGITTVPAKGAFTNEQKEMMIIVITRYELYDLEKIINEVDPNAFTNVVQTTQVLGFFRKD
ncbi:MULTISPECIES: YitT family protein [Bacillus]|uniref:YitT family protein n=1 Tax=Bacillus TaxID=1386 RepID=UPI0022442AFE|nr:MULTISPECIES: YitT family protein [Bacillus]MDN5388218.1 YitT family protein [Bacillus sp. LB7]MEC1020790.1 YitT family protein [Bacillus paralicheniformis]MEC1025864.1 YitT family protein [Bacillus paralicheniformis]MEC1036371.1 YitT family protein [Bacillus paralicheniformis]MEC1058028.1 YitT family protein [Bacillus paralicheniformis]